MIPTCFGRAETSSGDLYLHFYFTNVVVNALGILKPA
jgi:hypothetical protein